MRYLLYALALCGLSVSARAQNTTVPDHIVFSPAITTPPDSLHLDTFYAKYLDAEGIPVIASKRVSDSALYVGRDIINYMLAKRPDVRKELVSHQARLSIIGRHEMQTDLPECRDWKKPAKDDERLTDGERADYDKPGGIASMTDQQYWNQRARGMGGIQSSCAEENLLGIPGTRYYGENITVHEFSHDIMEGLVQLDSTFYGRLKVAYDSALANKKYHGQYAINTIAEYWAEGTQWWFWSNVEFYDGSTRLQSPDDLKTYDPALYALLSEVYIGHHIPADVYYARNWNSPYNRHKKMAN
jgi:hypothetical protein